MMDDPSLLLMLSNLLHLQTYLDHTSSLLSPIATSSFPPSSSSFPATAPLLFFATASVLSYVSSTLRHRSPRLRRRRRSPSSSLSPPPPLAPPRSAPSPSPSSAIFFLSSDRALSMDPSARDARFRSLYSVSHTIFDTLLKNLRHLDAAAFPSSLPLDRALCVALARLSRGLSSRSLARSIGLPQAIVSRCTHALTRLLSTHLYARYVTLPESSDHLAGILQSFRDLTAFPNLAAAIASSPVRLRLPNSTSGQDADLLRSSNRPFPSILLQVVADHRKVFWDACVRAPGSSDPASHLRDSSLYQRLLDEDGPLPFQGHVITVRGQHVRPYLIGDSSYPLLPFLLTPFSSTAAAPQVSSAATPSAPAKEAFDSALAKGRAASTEAAIALLKGRWKILRNLNVGLGHAAQTVVACVVLHNICQFAKEPEDEGRYMWRDPP